MRTFPLLHRRPKESITHSRLASLLAPTEPENYYNLGFDLLET